MNTMVLLALISVVGVAALFVALVVYLVLISNELERIGGNRKTYGEPSSYLSKIRLGVRAIETHTDNLVPQETRLNTGLSAIRDGLGAINANLGRLIAAVVRQEGR